MSEKPESTPQPEPAASPVRSPIQINSTDLFQGSREVSILHGQEFYRLRLTKSGKLILHK